MAQHTSARASKKSSENDTQSRRQAALDTALAQVEKNFGKGSAMRLGDRPVQNVEVISTGSLALDMALGIGGLPRGRVVEIYGPESSGKTTLTLHAVANAQRNGGVAAFIDAEHALDPEYARKLGVDTDSLIISQPDNGEQALEIADMLIRSGALDIIVIDSVAALVPKAEIEGDMGDSHVGLQARLMSQALRKMTGALAQANTTAIFINQLREKIGVFFGSPETTTGGKALKFYSSVRLDIRRIQTLKNGDEAVGNRTRVKVVKNKMAPPFKSAEFDMLYGEGISREGSILDMALQTNIVKKSGSWFTYDGDQLGQGRENVRQFLKDNAELTSEIENRVKMEFGLIPRPEDSEDASGDKDAGDEGNNGTDGPHDNDAAAGVESADASAK
ncbi:recombinase RecA [Bifidobacterium crudilactis]|jgi:recombination protein RecA|uniref:Protein RecA n=1 Tax=Bifidobacterium crudilactis TaxID=327277 RepID=A0A971CY75_9BIFI|nr:recombinase RecA [Bifidobacterium crudilactis]MCI1867603.1 recombinase RecA [Bifidobacterium crudilactis]MDN5971958.1 recombinase RecA [Bifidobacterium crudilactis]MDN6001442.1 recombinase RecA [Bifidobacterium crudilactis]MDN6209573.1 recombinase RecA [Bifidobacterium crudilactis]MDN6233525.1 recombinase RecA [Bifidobacterium crudilactis]